MRVALVVMPWIGCELTPIGAGALKAYLGARGIAADLIPLNILFDERIGAIGPLLAENSSEVWPEWPFARALFGPEGTGELACDFAEIARRPTLVEMLRRTGISAERFEKLAREDVPAFLDDCVATVPWERYDVVGFSSVMASHLANLALAKRLKERWPAKTIVFGGSNVEGVMGPAHLEACEWIDYVVDGEGERALTELVLRLRAGGDGEGIPGVAMRRAGRVARTPPAPGLDMDSLPTPDYADFFKRLARSPLRSRPAPKIVLEGSRGCWWGEKQHCTFCSLNGNSMAYRFKDSTLILRDLKALHRRHASLDFMFADSILGMRHADELIPMLRRERRENGLDLSIFFEAKSNLGEDRLASFAEAGVDKLLPGIESLSTPLLKRMRKGVTAIQNLQLLKFATERGIELTWYLLAGFPGEDPAEYDKMAELVPGIVHLAPPTVVQMVRPGRHSPYFERPQEFGIDKPVPHEAYEFVYPRPRFDLSKVAFFHDFAAPLPFPRGLAAAVENWRASFDATFFAVRQGENFAEVFDSRPLAGGGLREERVSGLEALALRSFRSIAGLPRLEEEARAAAAWPGESKAERRLKDLVERRWLFEEGGRWLALPVRYDALPPSQRFRLERLRSLPKAVAKERGRSPAV